MLYKSFEEMGIPPGYGFKRLLFCPAVDTLVVQTQSIANWRPERLYARPIVGERYESIGTPAELVSQEDPVLSPSHSLLAYNTLLHSFRLDSEGNELHGGDWQAIRVVDLRLGTETHVIDRETLHLPDRDIEVWIDSLLAFAECPEVLHVVAALKRASSFTVERYVSELQLSSGLVRPLANLPASFL